MAGQPTFLKTLSYFFSTLCLVLTALPVVAQERIQIPSEVLGTRTAYAGYEIWLRIDTGWYDLYPVTAIDTATDTLTLPGHNLRNGQTVRMFSLNGANLPVVVNGRRDYDVCNASSTSIRLGVVGCSPIVDFTNTGSGVLHVGQMVPAEDSFVRIVSLPQGVTVSQMECGTSPCTLRDGRYRNPQGHLPVYMRFLVSSSAPRGTFNMTLSIESDRLGAQIVTHPLTIKTLPAVVKKAPTTFPPIPGKDKWVSTMVSLGEKWCSDQSAGTISSSQMAYGFESGVWFYDGAWVFYQMADYLKDPKWNNCGNTLARWYRDLTLSLNGGHAPIKVFSDGLVRLSRQPQEAAATQDALLRMVTNPLVLNRRAGDVYDVWIRETAYFLETQMNAARAHGYGTLQSMPTTGTWGTTRTRAQRAAVNLMSMLDGIRGGHFVTQQNFMTGLALKALTEYYDFSGDPRVPEEVRLTLDYIWANAWNRSDIFANYANKLLWHADDAVPGSMMGPRCPFACRNTNDPNSAENALINMVAPAYAWYWNLTGNDLYRQRGDKLFEHSLDQSISFHGKMFSQNYRWSFDFVRMREGAPRIRP
jgi:hypothetical protein